MLTLGSTAELNLLHTLTCGQCFRWKQEQDGHFYGIADGKTAHIWTENGKVLIESSEENAEFWRRYFGLELDYDKVIADFQSDEVLQKSVRRGRGIRILRQNVWETTISFICSANNNIPRIEKMLHILCALFGEKIEWQGRAYDVFPTPQRLAELSLEQLAPLRAGYRDKYILDTAKMIAGGELDLETIQTLSTQKLRRELCRLPGVGPKVADCIMLFGMGRYEVFPKDVWTKRILQEVYRVERGGEDAFIRNNFGRYAGIAQQYLYYYFREIS